MRRGRVPSTRAAYASMLVILISGVLLLFVVVLGRYAVDALAAERTAALETRVDQILLSARDWSRLHSEQLRDGGEVELPLGNLIPSTATGRLTLRCDVAAGAEPPLVECDLQIKHGHRSVARRVCWPAPDRPSSRQGPVGVRPEEHR